MSFVKFALVAAALARVADLASAQTPAPDTIDLARAIALARVANPMLAARDAEVRAAGARIAPAGALPDPRLTLGAMNYMLPSLSARMDPLSMNQVTLTQMVPINGTLGLRRASARHDSTRTAYLREATSLMIESEVRARYWELYHTDRSLEIMDRTLALMRELSNVARTMYAVGATVQSDVLRSQVAITRLQQEIAEMQLQRFRVATAFNALLGRPGESPVVLPPPAAHAEHGTPMHALELPEPPSLDSLMAVAAERNPEILAMQAGLDRAASEARLARRMIVPDLELGVGYGQRPGDNDMLSLMIGASLPVFARSRQLRMRDEANAMRSATEQELAALRLRVRSELAAALEEARTARRLVQLYGGSLVPQALATYEASLAAYRVGRVDFPTVLEAQTTLLMYEHDLHRFEAMYGTASAMIDRLTGTSFGEGRR